jgi:alpha-glucosidase
MIEDLKAKGVKIICIIDPGVKAEEGYFVYEQGLENEYFATQNGKVYHNAVWPGDSVFPQFTLKETRKWWGGLTKKLTDIGVAGIWNDMNEPASFNGPLPLDVEFKADDRVMYHKEVHNIYGHLMAEATYKGIKENTGLRPFVITRACYAGTQKYSTAWTGDNHSIWAHLEMAIPQLANLGLSGMPFVGTDIGGFGSDTTKELLIRWVQLGIFSPLCRNHSAAGTRRQEPWTFDDETAHIYSKFIHLRYKLIPYIYDLFVEHSKTGLPVNRPLVLNYPNDENTFNLNDEFMLGDNILVAPILKVGQTKRMVYLPEGMWVRYDNHKVYNGNQYVIVEAKLDECPIFVKYNSIIPTYSNTNIENPSEIVFECYGESGEYLHYQDNGLDFNYETGEYNIYKVSFNNNNHNVELVHNGYNKYNSVKVNIIK